LLLGFTVFMRIYLIALLIISLAFTACKSNKQGYTGFVYNNGTNKPLKGVKVMYGTDSTTTDSAGYFELNPKNGSGLIVFRMPGFYTDSFATSINHSGEQMEELFNDDKIGLYPVNKNFSTREAYLLSKQPKPLDTGVVYSSAQVKPFHKVNKTQDYTFIKPVGYSFGKYNEPIIPVKGSQFNYDIKQGTDFITVKELSVNHVPCRLIAYSLPGENDTRIINFQLNSYDNNHHLLDALLLDNRFTFEIIYYDEFKIHGDGKILINRYSVNRFEQNEQGDLIGEKAKPDTSLIQDVYQLNDKGIFIAIKP
jgi:hypothetical protein